MIYFLFFQCIFNQLIITNCKLQKKLHFMNSYWFKIIKIDNYRKLCI